MSKRLEGKVALVTGAGGALGNEIARRMAAEGARLFLSDLDGDACARIAAETGGRMLVHDVTSEAHWSKVAGQIDADCGALNILVNNAGIEFAAPIAGTTFDQWRKVIAVNLDSMFLGCRAMAPLLARGGQRKAPSSVINMSSVGGLIGFPGQVSYCVSKSGARHLAKALAVEWGELGFPIRINSIHPGPVQTPMLAMAVESWVRDGLVPADNPWASVEAMCPIGWIGEPVDVAMAAVFLASDETRWMTGSEIVIDGGFVAR